MGVRGVWPTDGGFVNDIVDGEGDRQMNVASSKSPQTKQEKMGVGEEPRDARWMIR